MLLYVLAIIFEKHNLQLKMGLYPYPFPIDSLLVRKSELQLIAQLIKPLPLLMQGKTLRFP